MVGVGITMEGIWTNYPEFESTLMLGWTQVRPKGDTHHAVYELCYIYSIHWPSTHADARVDNGASHDTNNMPYETNTMSYDTHADARVDAGGGLVAGRLFHGLQCAALRPSHQRRRNILGPVHHKSSYQASFFQNGLQAKAGFEMCFDIGSRHFGCRGQNTSPYAQGCDLS